MAGTTTIRVNKKTRDALRTLKGRRSYDEFLGMLLRLVPEVGDEGKFAPDFRASLLAGLLYDGARISYEDVRRDSGLA